MKEDIKKRVLALTDSEYVGFFGPLAIAFSEIAAYGLIDSQTLAATDAPHAIAYLMLGGLIAGRVVRNLVKMMYVTGDFYDHEEREERFQRKPLKQKILSHTLYCRPLPIRRTITSWLQK